MVIPQVKSVMIPENSQASEMKYVIIATMKRHSVSVIAEWVRKRIHLNIKLLIMPPTSPTTSEERAKRKNYFAIMNGDCHVKLKFDLKPWTVLNNMMLTISLNTPSPYTIENNFG